MTSRRTIVMVAPLWLALVVAGCAGAPAEHGRGSAVGTVSASSAPTAPPGSSAPPGARAMHLIELGSLPPQGVVVTRGDDVAFVDLSGEVVATLNRFDLAMSSADPKIIVLRDRTWPELEGHYVFDATAGELRPIGTREAARVVVPPDPPVRLPPPPGGIVEGAPAGSWRWAIPSPDGSTMLAQWSGECEVPVAFFVDPATGRMREVTGGRGLRDAPESTGFGWSADGRAVVALWNAVCGRGFDQPGVYLFDRPGHGVLLFGMKPGARAAMWGPA
jgi:hypothetical protein